MSQVNIKRKNNDWDSTPPSLTQHIDTVRFKNHDHTLTCRVVWTDSSIASFDIAPGADHDWNPPAQGPGEKKQYGYDVIDAGARAQVASMAAAAIEPDPQVRAAPYTIIIES